MNILEVLKFNCQDNKKLLKPNICPSNLSNLILHVWISWGVSNKFDLSPEKTSSSTISNRKHSENHSGSDK